MQNEDNELNDMDNDDLYSEFSGTDERSMSLEEAAELGLRITNNPN